jgi:6-phosphogluconolactonase/glucosamine-6-phosphate isomerase/deaminase
MNIHTYENPQLVAKDVAQRVAALIHSKAQVTRVASLTLSGQKTSSIVSSYRINTDTIV